MKYHLVGGALAIAIAAVNPAAAQAPQVAVVHPPQPPAAGPGGVVTYPFNDPTPDDAYRDGDINRWELEQYEGPLPQALQGPSADGNRGGDDGGGDYQ